MREVRQIPKESFDGVVCARDCDMSELLQMLDAAAQSIGADIVVGFIVIVSFAMALLGILFFLLAVRGIWRYLTRHTVNDVIVSSQRKALR
jgi:hypothetical protein